MKISPAINKAQSIGMTTESAKEFGTLAYRQGAFYSSLAIDLESAAER